MQESDQQSKIEKTSFIYDDMEAFIWNDNFENEIFNDLNYEF